MSNRLNHDQVRHIARPDLVPTVCKCYQQMTLAGISFNFTFGLCMKQNQYRVISSFLEDSREL